jgi:hypothetical protein
MHNAPKPQSHKYQYKELSISTTISMFEDAHISAFNVLNLSGDLNSNSFNKKRFNNRSPECGFDQTCDLPVFVTI